MTVVNHKAPMFADIDHTHHPFPNQN